MDSNKTYEARTCQDGLLLPFLDESQWDVGVRAFIYLVALIYCFLGIAIVADVFMCAIEKITSKTRRITLSAQVAGAEPDVIEVKVWNETVANLTLMALGSSAPEILLACIEIIGNGFTAGDLGPGTIVGSAAFNLLVITAVCITAIPPGETRSIRMIKVFGVTAFFSVFAYVWLLVVLVGITPGVVDVWEAVVTLLFFPLLVGLAYAADRGFLLPGKKGRSAQKQMELQSAGDNINKAVAIDGVGPADKKQFFPNGELNRENLLQFIREIRKHPGLTDEDAACLAAARLAEQQHHTRMWYRVGAIRDLTGGRRTTPSISEKLQNKMDHEVRKMFRIATQEDESDKAAKEAEQSQLLKPSPEIYGKDVAVIEFNASACAVLEKAGKVDVVIRRRGKTDIAATIRVETIDGTATAGEDYIEMRQTILFQPGEAQRKVSVQIVQDNQWEPDETFFIKLCLPEQTNPQVAIGRKAVMEITIINDDDPGVFQFRRRGLLVRESVGYAQVAVIRTRGTDGVAYVHWRTKSQTASDGKDFVGGEGKLVFEHGEQEKNIEIAIVNDLEPEKDEHFEVELFDPSPGSALGRITKTTVTITNDEDFNNIVNRLMLMTNTNVDKLRLHSESWAGQLRDAMNVNGGDIENATAVDYVMHFFTFGWKVIFALIPPTGFMGGWLTFFVSLGAIGLVTAIVGDLAGIFGCLVGLEDTVTAITFVALGTSLPDLFASKGAARAEKYADNAIGNVTGSNSVNVFLGLGVPWVIAAFYWYGQNKEFPVPKDSLGFSVGIYCAVSISCIILLLLRRFLPFFGKAELGGTRIGAVASAAFLVFLWFLYVILSALKAYGHL
ncbi:sodium/calcium exchanger Calx-like [Ornithodoros turicata]|uniref:sodium/calcium exchanger Calx-like n=1 Tax=Ornithodoros turicata TaxID=34597 RepID=UPI00313A28FE